MKDNRLLIWWHLSVHCPISILGTVKGSNINIEIGVKVGAPLNQDVKATFVGTKLTGNESSEAKITGFTFDSDVVTEQPVIDDEKGTITFKVSKDAANEALILSPSITVSEKAILLLLLMSSKISQLIRKLSIQLLLKMVLEEI